MNPLSLRCADTDTLWVPGRQRLLERRMLTAVRLDHGSVEALFVGCFVRVVRWEGYGGRCDCWMRYGRRRSSARSSSVRHGMPVPRCLKIVGCRRLDLTGVVSGGWCGRDEVESSSRFEWPACSGGGQVWMHTTNSTRSWPLS